MSAPVMQTCPEIDKVIKWINEAMEMAKNGRKTFPEADDLFHDIYYALDGCESMLEDLRRSNDALRKWGYALEKEVKELQDEVSSLENQLENVIQEDN